MITAVAERETVQDIILPDLSKLTTEQLEAEFAGALKDTADGLLRLAAAASELERRGRDLSHLKLNLISYLRMIAARQLLPEVVLYLGDQKAKVQAIANLPIEKQQKLLDADEVHVLVENEDVTVSLRELSQSHLKQVFSEHKVRTIAEQRAFVREKQSDKPVKIEPKRNVKPEPARNGIKVGNSFAPVADVVGSLSELAGPLDILNEDLQQATATARLTNEENEALEWNAKSQGISKPHLVRMALHAYGLLRKGKK